MAKIDLGQVVGPAGPQGEKGATGAQGPQGARGVKRVQQVRKDLKVQEALQERLDRKEIPGLRDLLEVQISLHYT